MSPKFTALLAALVRVYGAAEVREVVNRIEAVLVFEARERMKKERQVRLSAASGE